MAKSNEKALAQKEEEVKDEKKAKKPEKSDKNKKPNVFVRMGRKLKETFSELKRVTWPSFGKAIKATGVVLAVVLVFTVLVMGVNYGFSELLQYITGLGA